MTAVVISLVNTLQDGLEGLVQERRSWEETLAAERQRYEERERVIQSAIAALTGTNESSNGSSPTAPEAPEPESSEPELSIGQDKLAAVRKLLEKQGCMRQADIAKKLKFNSGTVSVALRVLQEAEVVSPGEKENGSRVWWDAKVRADSRQREHAAAA